MNRYFYLLILSATVMFSSSIWLIYATSIEDVPSIHILMCTLFGGSAASVLLLAALIKLDKAIPTTLKTHARKSFNMTNDAMPSINVAEEA